jgi:hypothetical protein
MARTFQDANFLEWQAFATTGKHGFEEDPNIVFQCITTPELRPRIIAVDGIEAEAQARVINATDAELVAMLASSKELP